jgi:hypothetical protein
LGVAVLDIACAALLIGSSRQADIVAAIFVVMVPIYVIGAIAAFPPNATYAIIDLLAVVQLGVIANGRGGMAIHRRYFGRRGNPVLPSAQARRYAPVHMGGDIAADR